MMLYLFLAFIDVVWYFQAKKNNILAIYDLQCNNNDLSFLNFFFLTLYCILFHLDKKKYIYIYIKGHFQTC